MINRSRHSSRIPFVVFVVVGLVITLSLPVLAHTELVGSDPEEEASVATLPERVTLTFSDIVIEPVAVAVIGPNGNDIAEGGASISEGEVTQGLAVESNQPAGTYTIAYQVSATDGHPLTGEVVFTLEARSPTSAVQPTTSFPTTPTVVTESSTQPTTTNAAPTTIATPTSATSADVPSTTEIPSQDGVSTGVIISLAGGLGVALAVIALVVFRSVKQRGDG